MNWEETSKLAIEALRANKLRAILTMLGVIIGSACIVLVVTVALTGKKYIGSQIEAVGSNIVYAWLEQSNTSQNVSLADQISLGDLNAIREGVPGVVQISGTNDIPMNVIANRQVRPVRLIGVTQGFQDIRRLLVLQGRYFDDADFSTVSKVCVISEHLAQIILPGGNPVGTANSRRRVEFHGGRHVSRAGGDVRAVGNPQRFGAGSVPLDQILRGR